MRLPCHEQNRSNTTVSRFQAVNLLTGIVFGLAAAACASPAGMDFTLELGPELNSFHYREPGLMQEDGFLAGGFASFTAVFQSNVVWNIRSSLTAGTLRYDGQTMEGEPVKLNTPNQLFYLRTSLGYRLNPVTPFVGIGLRYWHDNLGAASAYGYDRQTVYLYSPLGLEISKTFGTTWTLGARGELDWFWGGLNHNTDFPLTDNETIDLRQHSGYGTQLSIFVNRPMTQSAGLMIESFFQYWNIDESEHEYVLANDGIYEFFEPANATSLIGLRGGIRW